jgi:Mg2+/citrate symporter
MDSFPVHGIDAIFKMIEERIPFGRALTTTTATPVILATILFTSRYILQTLGFFGGGTSLARSLSYGLQVEPSEFVKRIVGYTIGTVASVITFAQVNRGVSNRRVLDRIEQFESRLKAVEQNTMMERNARKG